MMALEFADGLGRYMVNRPVPGAADIKQCLLALTLAAAWLVLQGRGRGAGPRDPMAAAD